MTRPLHDSVTVGEYLISTVTRTLQEGWFGGTVSIRSGGVERILRLTRLFRDPLSAAAYARGEGLRWIAAPQVAAAS